MSLSVPRAGSGWTARPPGSRESTPLLVGSTGVEDEEVSSGTEESSLGSLSEAPVSNDRCADNDVREFYGYLLRRMEEDDRREASSGWDWKKIHGEDYEEWQEPLAPVHTNDEYYNDHFDDDEWYNDESDSDSEDYMTSRVNTKSLQPAATGHHYKGTTVRRSGAEPAPQGKGSGTKWVRHFQEIHNNFVQRLLSGNFGWPPLRRRSPLGLTDELEWEN